MENEAPVVMFTNYKRTDGFEVSLTLRGEDLLKVATTLDSAIKLIASKGGTPVTRQKQAFVKKEPEYVQDRNCPKCGNKLVKATTKAGKPFEKCSTQKYDFATKTTSGCDFVNWGDQPTTPTIPERQIDQGEYRG